MKLLGQILLVCVLLSVLKALVAFIAIGIVLLLIWGLLFRTPETVGIVAFSLLLEALRVHPLVTVGLILLLLGIVWLAGMNASTRSEAKPADVGPLAPDAEAGPDR